MSKQTRYRIRIGALAALLLLAVSVGMSGEDRDELSRRVETDPLRAARVAKENGGELIRMRWHLGGFIGSIAGLFLPSNGDVLLTFVPGPDERIQVQLLITAPSREDDYYLYGAEIDEESGATTTVWSAYAYKKKYEAYEQELDDANTIDFASGLYNMRWNAPSEPLRQSIWVDGDLHPVDVRPLKPETRKISGVKLDVQGYELRGSVVDGEREFKERVYIYFARDDRSTPVEIVAKRAGVRIRVQHADPRKLATQP